MSENIGSQIKSLAKFCAYACIIGGILVAVIGLFKYLPEADYLKYASVYGGAGYGYRTLTDAGDKAYMGLQMLKYGLAAAIAGYIGSLPLYGFGQLIEDVSIIAKNSRPRL